MGIAVAAVPNSLQMFPYLPQRSCGSGGGGSGSGGISMRKKYLAPLDLGGMRTNACFESMKASSLLCHRLSNLTPFIIFYLLIFLAACTSAYGAAPAYQNLKIQSEESSYRTTALVCMGAVPSSEKEEPAVYEFLSVSITNGSAFNLRQAQIEHDSFTGTHLTWIKAGDCLLIRLLPQEHSLVVGPYLKQVISVGNEIKPADVPKPRRWSWGLLLNETKKVKAMLGIVEAVISEKWKIVIKILKALLDLLNAFRESTKCLVVGPYLKQVVSVGKEIKPDVCFPKPGGWSWGKFLFNETKKVEATLDIAAAIIGLYSKKWETRIKIVKDLLRGLIVSVGPYLKQVVSVGDEIEPAAVSFPKAGGLSWGFLFNQTKKVEATLDIVAAIIGLYSKKWENRIKIVKALLRGLVAFFGE